MYVCMYVCLSACIAYFLLFFVYVHIHEHPHMTLHTHTHTYVCFQFLFVLGSLAFLLPTHTQRILHTIQLKIRPPLCFGFALFHKAFVLSSLSHRFYPICTYSYLLMMYV